MLGGEPGQPRQRRDAAVADQRQRRRAPGAARRSRSGRGRSSPCGSARGRPAPQNSSMRALTSWRVTRSRAAIEARSTWSTTRLVGLQRPRRAPRPRGRAGPRRTAIHSCRSRTILCSGRPDLGPGRRRRSGAARTLGTTATSDPVMAGLLRRCRCGAGRRRCGSSSSAVVSLGHGRSVTSEPTAVTASTRPPAVTSAAVPVAGRGAGVDDVVRPSTAVEPGRRPSTTSPVLGVPRGSRPPRPRPPPPPRTCQDQRLGQLGEPAGRGRVQQRWPAGRRAAPAATGSRGPRSGR